MGANAVHTELSWPTKCPDEPNLTPKDGVLPLRCQDLEVMCLYMKAKTTVEVTWDIFKG